MHHLRVATVGLVFLAGGTASAIGAEPPDILVLVDPFVGTGGHGHTYPGATVPFGMVQVSPDTHTSGWDWCSGYHYSDTSIMGFSLTHLSGTGIGDMLDVLLMPTAGPLQLEPGTREQPDSGYRSRFSHEQEKASPGYYSVRLADTGIGVELTATERVGLQRYTFPASDAAHVVLDLDHRIEADGWRSAILDSAIEVRGDDTIVGWRRITRWAVDRHVYFAARFSKPFAASGLLVGTEPKPGLRQARGKRLKAWVDYRTSAGEAILVRVAILIGQYAHGNEPSHHVAYLYAYAGSPWKTQERVRGILDTMYGDTPDGLSGNEDCGQMSAWYVLSTLGLYPVDPASATYVLASPLFDCATIDLGEGRRFTVRVERSSPADVYLRSATLGGKPLPRAWITHDEVMTTGELRVVLGPKPNPGWAADVEQRPPSMTAMTKAGAP